MSEILEEMLHRAEHLAMTRGQQVSTDLRALWGLSTWEWKFIHPRITCIFREVDEQVLVSIRCTPDRSAPRLWIRFVDPIQEKHSLYIPERYEEATAIMRGLMVLEDIADV